MLKTEYAFIFTAVQIESENMDKHQVLKIKIKIRQTLYLGLLELNIICFKQGLEKFP